MTRTIVYNGQEMTFAEVVRASGTTISVHRLRQRVIAGWPLARALHLPAVTHKRWDSLRPLPETGRART
jgi:hypothetical protein